ncbi:MAG: alpha/beta fold hydrolase [Proteobacteria bacterium]|nr:alpha/beta fold hydrolase [Pseudomonadota bacterium]MBS0464774.1 alpha/beta fold hydrolase [Pseudomonadota bacterium]
MTPRNIFRLALAIAAAGYLAWSQLAPHHAAARKPAAGAQEPPPPPRKLGSLAFQPCTLSTAMAPTTVAAQCTRMDVPEDRAHPGGRTISLAIAWVPSRDDEAAPDPVFMLAGGPGQSALESYPGVAPAFSETRKQRDVILVDQRGTGGSNPLSCKGIGNASGDQQVPDALDDPATLRRLTAECRDALAKKADLRFYTTTDAIADLDAVRAAIGADKIDLVGISYGTRVAQQYARTYAAHTRAVVLDSVAPNELIFGNDFARNLEDALALQFKLCANEPACAKKLGEPKANLDDLLAKLKANPQPVDYRDPQTGAFAHGTLTRADVAILARMYAYQPIALATLPIALADALGGHYAALKAQASALNGNLGDSMAEGMQLSVICAEDADGLKVAPEMASSVLGNQLVQALQEQCAAWPHGTRPADFHQPLVSDLPILVLEGEFDPVTPPRYGKQVTQHLHNGRMLLLRGQGHNVIGVGCMPKLMAHFFETANAKALDASCLDALPRTPPFTSYSGWEP